MIGTMVSGRFDGEILPDGKHVNLRLIFNDPAPQAWIDFAYCNDLVWRVHAMGGEEIWMSTLRMELYRKLFRHVSGEQYLVPGAE